MALTPKQRLFVEYYLQTWNARESAERAKYGSPVKAGYRLIHHPEVSEYINERIKKEGVGADEVIARMAQYVRNNPANFFIFGDAPAVDAKGRPLLDDAGRPVMKRQLLDIDWATFERFGFLVRKLSYDRKGRPVFEFYDAQRALEMLGRYASLDVGKGGEEDSRTIEDLSAVADLIAEAKERDDEA